MARERERSRDSGSTSSEDLLRAFPGGTLTELTQDGSSFLIHIPQWHPSPSPEEFEKEWQAHPEERKELIIFGQPCLENRFSKSWGREYAYSGGVNESHEPAGLVVWLLGELNGMCPSLALNGVLQNWYEVENTIGLHSDDERTLRRNSCVVSLSWGGPRRFVLCPKDKEKGKTAEVLLRDGDLAIMGGTTQKTHKHAIPKHRKTMDEPAGRRISWTARSFR